MREAYLTGGEHFDATDTPATTEAATAPVWHFASVAITDDWYLTLTGNRYGGDATDEFTITRHCQPHPDLLRALRQLTLHMCLLSEHLTTQQLYPTWLGGPTTDFTARVAMREGMATGEAYVHELLESYRCTSVQWKPKGVVLKGVKKARYRFVGNALKVETPAVELRLHLDEDEDLQEWEYPFFEQMSDALRDLTAELVSFMGGKYGEGGQQLELFGREAPTPTLSQALEVLDEALTADQRRREARAAADAEAATLAATEDAIDNPAPAKKRPARRKGERKGGKKNG